jgi:hypothetical protein
VHRCRGSLLRMGDHLVGGILETKMEKSLTIGSNTPKFAYVDVNRNSPAAFQASESRLAAIAIRRGDLAVNLKGRERRRHCSFVWNGQERVAHNKGRMEALRWQEWKQV